MSTVMADEMRVLLVEDNVADARLVQINLADAAAGTIRVAHVSRLADAMPAIEDEQPACILLDLGLPDADGLEAVTHLVSRVPDIPIIVLTGRDDDQLGSEAVNLGAQDYLTKGEVEPRALVRAVRYAIERDAYTRALRRSEEAYRLVFTASPQPVVVYDRNTLSVLATNDAAQAAYGYTAEVFSRMRMDQLVDPEQSKRFVHTLAGLPAHPTVLTGTWCHRRSSGEQMLVEVSSAEVWFDGRPARMAVVSDVSERERAIEELRASEARYRTIVETASEGVWVLDQDMKTVFANQRMAEMLGCTVDEMLGREPSSFLDGGSESVPGVDFHRIVIDGVAPCDMRFTRKDGSELWALIAASPLLDDRRAPAGCIAMVTDLTERRRAEESQRRSAAIVESSDDAILAHDLDGAILAWNPGAERMFGYTADEAAGRDVAMMNLPDLAAEHEAVVARVAQGERVEHLETRRRHRDGSVLPVSMTVSPIRDGSGTVTAAAVIVRDVTERWKLEEELRRQALHDGLTGLPNRTLIVDRLEQALARSGRTGRRVAVLFLDLDRFKTVNDSQGHSRGDELLILVAARLTEAVRADDTVARLGGDEFVVVCEEVEPGEDTAERVAARINEAMAEPFMLGSIEVVITVSIGIAVGASGDAADDLVRDADAAMYQAKEQGRARAEMFDEKMRSRAEQNLALGVALRRAATHAEFDLAYQPVVSLANGAIIGVEALLRWNHPERGQMRPGAFVPLAEDTGLIVPIGRWVIEEACRQLAEWRKLLPALTISVNVSPRQLAVGEFFDTVASSIESSRIPPASLVLEITEGVLMENVSASLAALTGLRAAGVSLAVDDFGTGYSSLSYLKRLPIDVLKIDRGFVDGLPKDTHDSAIVSAMVALARTFGLTVIAEGVESAAQANALLALGCSRAQGFHFARPLAAEPFAELLARQVEQGAGLPWPGHSSQDEVTAEEAIDIRPVASGRGVPFGVRYRCCPHCGNKGAYLVPGRPIVRCKYCTAFVMLSMKEHALAERDLDPYVARLRSEGREC